MSAAQIRFATLWRREVSRFMKIKKQTIGAPLLETFLYISVFGAALGTRIEIVGARRNHPILRGVKDVWVQCGAYVGKPAGSEVLTMAQPLNGMTPQSPADPALPPMPSEWTRSYTSPSGRTGRVFTSLNGASEDLLNEGYRRAPVNGTWHAFDRGSGAWRWSRVIDNASLLLDQALDVPLLVFNEHIHPPDSMGQGTLVQRVRCFDRRTGELLHESQGSAPHNYYVVERDEAAGWVDLRLPGQIVRFDYSAQSE